MNSISKHKKNKVLHSRNARLLKDHPSALIIPAMLFGMVLGFNYVGYYSSIAFFVVFTIWFWQASLVDSFVFLFAIQPLTTIFKLNSSTSSFAILFYALFILKAATERGRLTEYRLPEVPFAAVVVLIAVQGLDALFLGASMVKIMALLLNVMLCVVGSEWLLKSDSEKKDELFLLVAVSYCCSLVVMIVSADLFPSIPKTFLHDSFFQSSGVVYERFSGLAGDANYYSQLVLCGIAFAIGIFHSVRVNSSSAVMVVVAVFLIVSGARSYSKSFYITLVIILVIGLFLLAKKGFRSKQGVVSLIVALPIALFVVFVVVEQFVLPGFNLRLESGQDLTTGRTKIWAEYAELFFSNVYYVLFGTGFNNAQSFIDQSPASHNAYIEVIVEFGVIGTVSTIAALWPSLKSLRHFFSDVRLLYFAVIAITSAGLALSDYDFVFLSIMLLAAFSGSESISKETQAALFHDDRMR